MLCRLDEPHRLRDDVVHAERLEVARIGLLAMMPVPGGRGAQDDAVPMAPRTS